MISRNILATIQKNNNNNNKKPFKMLHVNNIWGVTDGLMLEKAHTFLGSWTVL